MKELIKKLAQRVFEYLLENADKYKLRTSIACAYREQAKNDLILETRIIQVKRGKMRYHCLVLENEHGTRRISLQRFPIGQKDFHFIKQKAA